MAVTVSRSGFINTVKKSGLIQDDTLGRLMNSPEILHTESFPPEKLAEFFQQKKLLTAFQCKTLLTGKYRGLLLGPYKILEPIGKGGMGAIYLAEHTTLQRQVAIKILPTESARKPELLQRFYREARAAAALDHPNIVKLYDVSQGAGTHFLVMEYVQGKNLQQVVASRGPIPYQEVVKYLVQAAEGLKHAHAKGFVHRDIKPDNIIITKEGIIKILDMGLARSLESDQDNVTKMMNPNAIYGSVDYVSPEQSIGGKVDARSDLYSLGATAFALITGRAPFQGTSAQVLVGHQLSPVPSLSKLRAAVPPGINAIVTKLLAKKPDDRFQSAEELIDALLPWMPAPNDGLTPHSGTMTRPMQPTETQRSVTTRRVSSGTREEQTVKNTRKPKVVKSESMSVRTKLALGLALASIVVAITVVVLTLSSRPVMKENQISTPAPAITPPEQRFITSEPARQVNATQCEYLNLSRHANAITTRNMFSENPQSGTTDTLSFAQYGQQTIHGIPFQLIDPQGTTKANAFIFGGGDSPFTQSRSETLKLPCNCSAKTIYFLGGISGWAFPFNTEKTVSLLVDIRYEDGSVESQELINGVHFADWRMPQGQTEKAPVIKQDDRERHLRYFTVTPRSTKVIRDIEFSKGVNQRTAPIFFAITIEKPN